MTPQHRLAIEMKDTVAGRLWRIVDRRMRIPEIEREYVRQFGPCRHETILFELDHLENERKLIRIKNGVYEP